MDGWYPLKQDHSLLRFIFIIGGILKLYLELAQPRKDGLHLSPYSWNCLLTPQWASCVRTHCFTLHSFKNTLKDDFIRPTAVSPDSKYDRKKLTVKCETWLPIDCCCDSYPNTLFIPDPDGS